MTLVAIPELVYNPFYIDTLYIFTMPSNKDRLYVALYARAGAATMPGGEDE